MDKLKYISKKEADALLDELGKMDFDEKRGGNSKAYIVGDYVILYTGNINIGNPDEEGGESPFDKIIDKLQQLKDEGVNVVPVLGYIYDDENIKRYGKECFAQGVIFQPRAKGQEMWERRKLPSLYKEVLPEQKQYLLERLATLSNASQEQFDKWVYDYKRITDFGIMVDPSKKDNFFYDENEGFSFIDLNFKGDAIFNKKYGKRMFFIEYALLPCLKNLPCDEENFTTDQLEFIKENNKIMFKKIIGSLIKTGIAKEDLLEEFSDHERLYYGTTEEDLKKILEEESEQ